MPINRDLPAGMPSRREATGSGALVAARPRQPTGQNVVRFIAREEQLHQARQYARANETTTNRTVWEAKQNLRSGSGARTQQRQQCVRRSASAGCLEMLTLDCNMNRLGEELELVNKELLAVRHDRLKKYYDACYNEYVNCDDMHGLSGRDEV